jgi:predicted PurR-regulated permease PerM
MSSPPWRRLSLVGAIVLALVVSSRFQGFGGMVVAVVVSACTVVVVGAVFATVDRLRRRNAR